LLQAEADLSRSTGRFMGRVPLSLWYVASTAARVWAAYEVFISRDRADFISVDYGTRIYQSEDYF
jgi:hypothetical protein